MITEKTIILGTDLHNKPSELASKLVRDLVKGTDWKILSIQNRKDYSKEKNTTIIPKIFSSDKLRRIFQGSILPFYLLFNRRRYKKIIMFWNSEGKYHYFLFKFMKILKYNINFVVISGYDKNYKNLKFCDKIICQSERMKKYLRKDFPKKDIEAIYSWTNLEVFIPRKKENIILIPSVPYKIKDFEGRGIHKIIKILKQENFKSVIIFRSQEAYNYFKNLNLKNIILINKILNDNELGKIMSNIKVIPLIYEKNTPDMPLSAIEGLASGCAIICKDNMGLADIIKKEKCGIVIKSDNEIIPAIKKIFQNINYNKNARKTAEKYFDKKNRKKYYN